MDWRVGLFLYCPLKRDQATVSEIPETWRTSGNEGDVVVAAIEVVVVSN